MRNFFKNVDRANARVQAVQSLGLLVLALSLPSAVLAAGERMFENTNVDDPEWKETPVPPAPAFDAAKLVTFEVTASSPMVYGIDPATLQLSPKDGLVRYVMVATSASGARNVLYEGIRCSTGEFKTYARYSSDGKWIAASDPQWKSMFGNTPSKHPLRFAKAGGCDNASLPQSTSSIVMRLKNVNFQTLYN